MYLPVQLLPGYGFTGQAAATSHMCIIGPALDTAAGGGRGGKMKRKDKTERYYIYLFKLVYGLKFLKVTSHEVQVQI